ncbi:MAG TPA: nitronate monooxygenase, partial [Xanthobacteraceae bacterium]
MISIRERTQRFCARFNLRVPILLAPMAGVPAPALSIAVANAGGLGSCGALLMKPDEILAWADEVRRNTNGAFQLNLWVPDPPPLRDTAHEARIRAFLGNFGPAVPAQAADTTPPDFAAQCDALLAVGP